jgi:hypothetical protein
VEVAPPPVPAAPEPVSVERRIAAMPSAGLGLTDLERLVADHGLEHPDRVDEWNSYLFFLRDHADVDGNLPRSFDDLIQDVFAPLL